MAVVARILRRYAFASVPVALRPGASRTSRLSALFTDSNRDAPSFLPAPFTPRYYSEAKRPQADESLLRVIQNEIQCAENDQNPPGGSPPKGFPFKIEDAPGQVNATLTREYQGEDIKVEVHIPTAGDEDDGSDKDEEVSRIPLVITVSKKGQPRLEFCCTAFPDEISIESLSIKNPESSEDQLAYEGPEFSDLDENLQNGFQRYLEVRGIGPSITNFMLEYMIGKDDKEYLAWLNKLKKFVEA